MHIERQPDGSFATTPILVGCNPSRTCVHVWQDEGEATAMDEEHEGIALQMQRCGLCKTATRCKLVGEEETILRALEQEPCDETNFGSL